jgi:hypothetical protein
MEFYDFPYIGNFIIPTDDSSIIFQRGRAQPLTSQNQLSAMEVDSPRVSWDENDGSHRESSKG